MSDFWLIDVETANPDYSSICQIGLVKVSAGKIIERISQLIDPKSFFDPFNSSIHGIMSSSVVGSPTLKTYVEEIRTRLVGVPLLHHGHFDRTAFDRASQRFSFPALDVRWLDTTKIVRRTWPEFSKKGYGLQSLAKHFDVTFDHHDALADAEFAADVVLRAIDVSGLALEDWFDRIKSPIDPSVNGASAYTGEGVSDQTFSGYGIAFTGSLSIPRREAAVLAKSIGFSVFGGPSSKTDFLVVGLHDPKVLAGYEKSNKHRKAEKMIQTGNPITIISENDFLALF
jgi:DNA polymerase-3 subunit epsilon